MPIKEGVTFLGVELVPGLIRPSAKAQQKFLGSVSDELLISSKAFREVHRGNPLPRRHTLISTLKRVEGIIDGWGKHYWFCNDSNAFAQLDIRTKASVRAYLGAYADLRAKLPPDKQHILLGLPKLTDQKREAYSYPKLSSK